MSLIDLKKQVKKRRGSHKAKSKLSVDDFIEGANAYAKGKVTSRGETTRATRSQRNFKNATFTLTPDNIEQLTRLSQQTGIAKSKIIRYLIDYAATHPQEVRLFETSD